MFRLVAVLAIATVVAASSPSIKVVKDFAEAKALYPTAEFVKLVKIKNDRGRISYALGNRVSGDGIVQQNQEALEWPYPRNVHHSVKYPNNGQTAIVSYVQLDVNQSSYEGEAYIVKGGLGQRSMEIIIEALGTRYLQYYIAICGL